jgi:integrase
MMQATTVPGAEHYREIARMLRQAARSCLFADARKEISHLAARLSTIRAMIEAVLDRAKSAGYRDGENPARWRGHLENMLPAKSKIHRVKHHPAMPYAEIPAFVTALRQRRHYRPPGWLQWSSAPYALEFLVLTAVRKGEVLGALWSEIDLETQVWTIPAERMKMERDHRVPLSTAALAVLAEMAAMRRSEFVSLSASPRIIRSRLRPRDGPV